jgi:hypothetical protein
VPRWSVTRLCSVVGASLGVLLASSAVHAELTGAEKAQVRSYVDGASLANVGRLRALVARPDLTEKQATDALAAALRPKPFTDATEAFLEALLFGPSSLASRSNLLPSVVQALLLRADAIFVQQPGDPTRGDGRAGRELLQLHTFVHEMLTEAMREGEGVAGLRADARHSVARAYAEHTERHRSFLAFSSRVQDPMLRLRVLVAIVLRKAADGVLDRTEVARVLDLGPTANGLFVRSGTLFEDAGLGPEVRRREVVGMLERVPGALSGTEVVVVSKASRAGWVTSGVLFLRTPLGPVAPRRGDAWPAVVKTADPEEALFEAAWVGTSTVAARRLAQDPGWDARVRLSMDRAAGQGQDHLAPWVVDRSLDRNAGQAGTISSRDFVAAPATLLLLDARRTVELSLMRSLSGHFEAFEQVLLGLELLVPSGGAGDGPVEVTLGRVVQGGVEPVVARVVLRGGRAVALELDADRVEAKLDEQGRVVAVLRNGGTFEVGDLAAIEVPSVAGDRWDVGDLRLVRLWGMPRIGALGHRRFLAIGGEREGLHGVHTQAPSADHRVTGRLWVERKGGLLVRVSPGPTGFHGVAVMIQCGDRCVARLMRWDGKREGHDIAGPVELGVQPATGFSVSLSIHGDDVKAGVADRELRARLATALPPGHVGWIVDSGARMSVHDWTIETTSSTATP